MKLHEDMWEKIIASEKAGEIKQITGIYYGNCDEDKGEYCIMGASLCMRYGPDPGNWEHPGTLTFGQQAVVLLIDEECDERIWTKLSLWNDAGLTFKQIRGLARRTNSKEKGSCS